MSLTVYAHLMRTVRQQAFLKCQETIILSCFHVIEAGNTLSGKGQDESSKAKQLFSISKNSF